MGRTVRLLDATLQPDEAGSMKEVWSPNEEGLGILTKTVGDVRLITINGAFRKGKSTFITLLLRMADLLTEDCEEEDAPKIGHDQHACTKGLTMWSEPIKGVDPETKKPVSIFLVDAEGSGSKEAHDQKHDTILFTISALNSHTFVHWTDGAIDEPNLEKMEHILQMAEMVQRKSTEESSSDIPNELKIPKLMWICRNIAVKFTHPDTKKPITDNEYLEMELAPNAQDPSKNRLRESLRSSFPERELFGLPYPCRDKQDINRLAQYHPRQLKGDFFDKMKQIFVSLTERTPNKYVCGHAISSGPILSKYFRMTVEKVQQGVIPDHTSALESLSVLSCMSACREAIELCWIETAKKKKMHQQDTQDMEKDFQILRKRCLEFYEGKGVYGPSVQVYREKLIENIEKQEEKYRKRNQEFLHEKLQKGLDKLIESASKCDSLTSLIEEVKKCRMELIENISPDGTPPPPFVLNAIAQEMDKRWPVWISAFQTELNKRASQLQQEVEASHLAVQEAKQQVEVMEESVKIAQASLIKSKEEANAQKQRMEEEQEIREQELRRLQQQVKDNHIQRNQDGDRIQTLELQVSDLQMQLKEKETECETLTSDLKSLQDQLQVLQTVSIQLEESQSLLETERNKCKRSDEALQKTRKELQEERKRSEDSFSEQRKRLQEMSEIQKRHTEKTRKEVQEIKKEYSKIKEEADSYKKENDSLQTKVDQQNKQIVENERRETKLRKEVEQQKTKLETLQQTHDESIKEFETLEQSLRKQKVDVVAEYQKKLDDSTDAYRSLEVELRECKRDLNLLRQEKERLLRTQPSVDQNRAVVKELEQKVTLQNEQIQQYKKKITTMDQSIEALFADLQKAENRVKEERDRNMELQREKLNKAQTEFLLSVENSPKKRRLSSDSEEEEEEEEEEEATCQKRKKSKW